MSKKPIDILLDKVKFIPIQNFNHKNSEDLYATHEGELEMGGFILKVYQLNDGSRVIEEESLINFFEGIK